MLSPLRLLLPALTLTAVTARAAITVPGADGSDGVLNITADTVIDLGLATAGAWDANNTANAGKGIYDATKWAVVFKYSSVTIAAGRTLSFKNNASRAPVVWLVNGNVTINGTVSLNGQNQVSAPMIADPGPGGFRGGSGYFGPGVSASAGFGIGGGRLDGTYGYGGSYGSIGVGGPGAYGNPSLVPLVGGSGGGGTNRDGIPWGGGGGGGAILIACANSFTLAGQIRSIGGIGSPSWTYSGAGSGGAVRIVSDILSGAGSLSAVGGSAGGTNDNAGGAGRIRIERVNNSNTLAVSPDPSVVDLAANATALLWPPTGAPEVKVLSIGGVNAPADPKAGFGTIGADVALASTATTTVVIETTNVEAASTLKVRGTPRSNANYSEVTLAPNSGTTITTTPLVIRWTASLPVATGYNAVQVRVIRP